MRWITVILATLALLFSTARAAPLAETAACRQALDSLQLQEESRRAVRKRIGAHAGADLAVEKTRRKAAQACLGGPADAPPAAARLQAPLSVMQIAPSGTTGGAPASALRQLLPPTGRTAPAPAAIRLPTTVSHCDSAGCWTSDGVYLMRIGPDLIGPPGLCSIQSNILFCR